MILTELAGPVNTVVPVRTFADHLRMGSGFADDGSEDVVLEMYLRVAAAAIEARVGKALITRRLRWVLTGWQSCDRQGLPVAPVAEMVSVRVVDGGGGSMVLDPGRYTLQPDTHRPTLVARTRSFPTIPEGGQAELVFDAGWGTESADVPADLRQAVMLLAANYYENRSGEGDGAMPFAVQALLDAHRPVRL